MNVMTGLNPLEGRRLLVEALALLTPTGDEARSPEGQRVIAAMEELCKALDDLGVEQPAGRRTA
jgi:hypothetical protein